MKYNKYFDNVWLNQFNHGWKHRYLACKSSGLAEKIISRHTPRGKCYKRMSNMFVDFGSL